MRRGRVAIVGAGIAGLVSALELARAGFDVRRFRAPGRARGQDAPGRGRRAARGRGAHGLYHALGVRADVRRRGRGFADEVRLKPSISSPATPGTRPIGWTSIASVEQSADAIGAFAGPREAQGFRDFCVRAAGYLQHAGEAVHPLAAADADLAGAGCRPQGPRRHVAHLAFHDAMERARRSFSRPAPEPAVWPICHLLRLFAVRRAGHAMLVAHVEQEGVWIIEDGMLALAQALAHLAEANGARFTLRRGSRRGHGPAGRAAGLAAARRRDDRGRQRYRQRRQRGGARAVSSAASVARAVRQASRSALALGHDIGLQRADKRLPAGAPQVFFSSDYAPSSTIFSAGAAAARADGLCLRAGSRRRCGGIRGRAGAASRLVNAPATGDTDRIYRLGGCAMRRRDFCLD